MTELNDTKWVLTLHWGYTVALTSTTARRDFLGCFVQVRLKTHVETKQNNEKPLGTVVVAHLL